MFILETKSTEKKAEEWKTLALKKCSVFSTFYNYQISQRQNQGRYTIKSSNQI